MSTQNRLKDFMASKIEQQKQLGAEFMTANKLREEVRQTPEGIQYEIIRDGSGASPLISDQVKAHYKGSLISGEEFDSSFKRGQPFTAPLRALIKGWQIVLPLMKTGSYWRLWIPSDLAYGDNGAGGKIPGGATLVFDIELIDIVK